MRVAVTYDLFRNASAGLPSIAENARWLFGILVNTLRDSSVDVSLHLVASDKGDIDTNLIYETLGSV